VDELFRRIREDEPQPPRQLAPAIPPELEQICLRALAKSLSGRYTTAGDFAAALRGILERETSREVPAAAPPLEAQPPDTEPSSSLRRRIAAHKRHVTVAVFNFELTDANNESSIPDAEYQHELVQAVARCCADAVQALGGTVLPSTGQEVVACFGFPVSYENAAERAIRAALQVIDEAQAPSSQLRGLLHAGDRMNVWAAIHSGTAVVEGGDGADAFSLVGDARTVASRMEPLTESGTITISDETERLLRGQFETECVGKRQLRGVAQPVTLYVVHRATGSKRQFDRAATGELSPLVGRDTELAILRDRWEHTAEGQGQVALLIGEAGLGKSRLVQEIRQHVVVGGTERIVEWNCSPYRVNSSLHPAIEYLQQALEFGTIRPAEAASRTAGSGNGRANSPVFSAALDLSGRAVRAGRTVAAASEGAYTGIAARLAARTLRVGSGAVHRRGPALDRCVHP
jgi:class 3 adenylate cyclase